MKGRRIVGVSFLWVAQTTRSWLRVTCLMRGIVTLVLLSTEFICGPAHEATIRPAWHRYVFLVCVAVCRVRTNPSKQHEFHE